MLCLLSGRVSFAKSVSYSYNLTQTADLSHIRLIFWEPDPRVARKHRRVTMVRLLPSKPRMISVLLSDRVHIGLAVFSVMPLLAPFVAIYATSFLTPHATYDRYSHRYSLRSSAFAMPWGYAMFAAFRDTSSYPLKWIVGTRDPAML